MDKKKPTINDMISTAELPHDCVGLRLRYRNTEMTVIQCDATHVLCRLQGGGQHAFKREAFTAQDIIEVMTKEINQLNLF